MMRWFQKGLSIRQNLPINAKEFTANVWCQLIFTNNAKNNCRILNFRKKDDTKGLLHRFSSGENQNQMTFTLKKKDHL